MNAYMIVAVVLIVAGILGLVYGHFSYARPPRGHDQVHVGYHGFRWR